LTLVTTLDAGRQPNWDCAQNARELSLAPADWRAAMKLLFIEDNRDILANVYQYFEALGYEVDSATDGVSGLALATSRKFDVIVLDLRLPRLDGVEVCRQLRQVYRCYTPVLMLTARSSLEEKIDGFDSGADDYMLKPFELPELDARLKALARRGRGTQAAALRYADVVLDLETREARRAGRRIALSPIGFTILATLLRAAPAFVSKADLEREIWGKDPPETDALRSHVYALRKAIDKPFQQPLLHTLHGVGYRLMLPDEPQLQA
jgi:DNA-binding response OmpR family regulator